MTPATTTITLKRPITLGDATYSQLTMREPTVGDQLDSWADGMSAGTAEVALTAILCGVSIEVMRKVTLADYRKIQGCLVNFPSSPGPAPAAASSSSPTIPAGD